MSDIYKELETIVVNYLLSNKVHIEYNLYKNGQSLRFVRSTRSGPKNIAELKYDTTTGDMLFDRIYEKDLAQGNRIQIEVILPLRDILLDNPEYFMKNNAIIQSSTKSHSGFLLQQEKKKERVQGDLSIEALVRDVERMKQE